MQMRFKVKYLDGREVEAKATPADVIDFERRYNVPYAALGQPATAREEWWYFLAWSPLHRSGEEPRELEVFAASIESVDVLDEDEPVPTKRGRSGAKSPASQSPPA